MRGGLGRNQSGARCGTNQTRDAGCLGTNKGARRLASHWLGAPRGLPGTLRHAALLSLLRERAYSGRGTALPPLRLQYLPVRAQRHPQGGSEEVDPHRGAALREVVWEVLGVGSLLRLQLLFPPLPVLRALFPVGPSVLHAPGAGPVRVPVAPRTTQGCCGSCWRRSPSRLPGKAERAWARHRVGVGRSSHALIIADSPPVQRTGAQLPMAPALPRHPRVPGEHPTTGPTDSSAVPRGAGGGSWSSFVAAAV